MTNHNNVAHPQFGVKKPILPAACPFCEGDAQPIHIPASATGTGQPVFMIGCPGCGATGPPRPDGEKALAAWNARQDPTLTPKIADKFTLDAARELGRIVRGICAGEYAEKPIFVLMLANPGALAGGFSMHVHGVLPGNAGKQHVVDICNVGRQLAEREMDKTPGGIIIPGV